MRIHTIEQLDSLRFDPAGLLPVVAQHSQTGEVLMLAFANREALRNSLESGTLWFYSRSRQSLWQKGETSGNLLSVVELHGDCDADAVLALVQPAGPACHSGARNCFGAAPTLTALGDVIAERSQHAGSESYTAKLLANENLRLKKLGEEATELALACQVADAERVAEEAADLLYHLLVAASAAGVPLDGVLNVLDRRLRSPSASGR